MNAQQMMQLRTLRNYVRLIAEQCEGERPWGRWGDIATGRIDRFASPRRIVWRKESQEWAEVRGDYRLFAEPFVLIETSHYGQTWVTLHRDADAAVDYHVDQEYAEDWRIDRIVDVRDMTEYRMTAKAERA